MEFSFKPLASFDHYLQSLIKSKLWIKVILALFLGAGFGLLLAPSFGWVDATTSESIGNWLALPGRLFLKLVQMIMIPLIFASIISGIVSNSGDQLKRMGIGVSIYFLITTTISIVLGVSLALFINPGSYMQKQTLVETASGS